MGITLAELARRLKARVRGDSELVMERVAPLERAGPHDISFLRGARHRKYLGTTHAGAVILAPSDASSYPGSALIVDNPHVCFARVAGWLHQPRELGAGIHPTAVIGPGAAVSDTAWIGPYVVVETDAVIGPGVHVGAGCYIGSAVQVGPRCRLYPHVTVYERCVMGKECIVHAGAVIGSDGFGFAKDGVEWIKVPQLGRVVIGDRVEIGANTTIDRGALDDTVIGDGVKLDNLIQIAHNVTVGEHSAMAAFTGIAGSAEIGKRCTFGGRVGVLGHLVVADDVHVTATSLVTTSIAQSGAYSSAWKAEAAGKWRKNAARLNRLDDLARRLRDLEQKIEKLAEEQKS